MRVNKIVWATFLCMISLSSNSQPNKEIKEPEASLTPAEKNEETSPVSGYLTFATNYIFRGISQTNNTPAAQASLTYTFLSSGIYFNLFGSNVYFTAPNGNIGTVEIDTIVGISNDIGEHFNYNISFQRYNYPKATQLEYNEAFFIATFYFFTGTIAYSANEYNVHKPGTYYNLAIEFPVPLKGFEDATLSLSAGHFTLPRAAGRSYNDYSAIFKKSIKNFDLALQWTNTNHRNTLDHSYVVASITANLS